MWINSFLLLTSRRSEMFFHIRCIEFFNDYNMLQKLVTSLAYNFEHFIHARCYLIELFSDCVSVCFEFLESKRMLNLFLSFISYTFVYECLISSIIKLSFIWWIILDIFIVETKTKQRKILVNDINNFLMSKSSIMKVEINRSFELTWEMIWCKRTKRLLR